MSILNKTKPSRLTGAVVMGLKNRLNRKTAALTFDGSIVSRLSAGIESLDGASFAPVESAVNGATEEIASVYNEATATDDGEVPVVAETTPEEVAQQEAQEKVGLESAALAAAAFGNLSEWMRSARDARPAGNMTVHAHSSFGAAGSMVGATPALESFDVQTLNEYKEYSIAYNLLAPRQDAFGEALFPTIVGTPNQAYLKVGIERPGVWNGAQHRADGKAQAFKKQNLIEAYRDATILENEDTRLVPWPAADGSSDHLFVDPALVANSPFDVNGIEVPTRPLKFVKQDIGFLGLCQFPGLLSAGVLDQTDAIDRFVRLNELYIVVTKKSDGTKQVVKVDTSRFTRNQFTPVREGHFKDTVLNFKTTSIKIGAKTKAVDAAALELNTVLAGKSLTFSAKVNGELNHETGVLSMSPTQFGAVSVIDANGVTLDAADLAPILSAWEFDLVGYVLESRRTNSNRRTRGKLLDRDRHEEIFEILLQPPYSIQKANNDTEAVDLDTLIKSTHIRISNLAVTTVLNYADFLKEACAGQDELDSSTSDIYRGNELEGIANMVVTKFYTEVDVDLEEVVNNLTSSTRLNDISGYFVGLIRELAYTMLQRSGYKAALDLLGSGNATPELIIATDNRLSQFIMVPGDDRTVGPNMDYRLVDTQDKRMRDIILLTFGGKTSGDINVLGFGNLIWIPELVSEMPVNRNGATIMETMVQPRFRHIVHLPIMARINVTGLDKLLRSKTAINFNQV
jgi:hypothetical protein